MLNKHSSALGWAELPFSRDAIWRLSVFLLILCCTCNCLAARYYEKTTETVDFNTYTHTVEFYDTAAEACAAFDAFLRRFGKGIGCSNPPGLGNPIRGSFILAANGQCHSPCSGPAHFYSFYAYWCSGPNSRYSPELNECVEVITAFRNFDKKQSCANVGNPINSITGTKHEVVDFGIKIGPLGIKAYYDTSPAIVPASEGAPFYAPVARWWNLSIDNVLSGVDGQMIYIRRAGEVQALQFRLNVDGSYSNIRASDKSFELRKFGGDHYYLLDFENGTIEVYKYWYGRAQLVMMAALNGDVTELIYTGIDLVGLKNNDGRQVFVRNSGGPERSSNDGQQFHDTYVNRILSFDNGVYTLATAGFKIKEGLIRIDWPDSTFREYMYKNSKFPWALTEIRDEKGLALSNFDYDNTGRAIGTRRAGDTGKYQIAYQEAPSLVSSYVYDATFRKFVRYFDWNALDPYFLTTPNGEAVEINTVLVNGNNLISSQSQPAGSGCASAIKRQDYDNQGNVKWRENFKGDRTCYANDLNRNLETSRVEGLVSNSSCDAVLPTGATLPANSRRISTQWHPIWRLETKVAEPRRLTTKVYNGQPDPFKGGATAWCAPSNGILPDGSPIVVLCKQVEQATTDTNGALGFSAALAPTSEVPTRVYQWQYNQYGQVLKATDPLGKVTTYTYYDSTTADYTKGDLRQVTNAANHATSYTKYNPSGQWLEMLDANGTATTRTFDLRQRLKTTTTAGLTTSYDYWPTGLLKQVTLPDATFVSYDYDDAHRLIAVTDNLGNKISYTLDNSGNRTGETVTDPSGKLARTLTRVPDALGRTQQITGRE